MNWICETTLKNTEMNIKVRQLTLNDLTHILTLQHGAIQCLEDKNKLSSLSEEEYRYIFKDNGLIIGAFDREKLIAFRSLLDPPIDEEHLGLDIGLKKSELKQVIYQEISIVHPDYRGHGLQQTLAQLIMNEFEKQEHDYRYVCCTVAPFNIPSLKDKFRQGMEMATLKYKYETKLRYIFVKDLKDLTDRQWSENKVVDMDDTTYQQELFSRGWRGYDMFKEGNRYKVKFGK